MILAAGEGRHSYHHKFPWDYAATGKSAAPSALHAFESRPVARNLHLWRASSLTGWPVLASPLQILCQALVPSREARAQLWRRTVASCTLRLGMSHTWVIRDLVSLTPLGVEVAMATHRRPMRLAPAQWLLSSAVVKRILEQLIFFSPCQHARVCQCVSFYIVTCHVYQSEA